MRSVRRKVPLLGRILCVACVALLVAGAAGCGKRRAATETAEAGALVPVTLQLGWYPESEYGGFYAAVLKGFYAEAGLDVTVKAGSPNMSAVQIVAAGGATFGLGKADTLLLARTRGIPVVAIATTFHTSPQALLFHGDQPIEDFTDLNGRTLFVVPGVQGYEYVKRKYRLDVKEQVHPGVYGPFIADRASVLHGFSVSEPCDVEGLKYLLIADSGYNVYENVIFTTDDVVRERPDLVRAFIAATVRGWAYYREAVDEVNAFILEFRPEATLESLRCKAELQEPFVYGGEADVHGFGYMVPERWATLRAQLIELGALKEDAATDGVFTNRFLPGREDEEV